MDEKATNLISFASTTIRVGDGNLPGRCIIELGSPTVPGRYFFLQLTRDQAEELSRQLTAWLVEEKQ